MLAAISVVLTTTEMGREFSVKYVEPLFHTTLVLVFVVCLIAGKKQLTGKTQFQRQR